MQNLKKTLTANPELWGWAIFGFKMVDLPQTSIFLGKIFNIVFIYLLTHFTEPNFKKFLQQTQGHDDFLGQFSQTKIFQKTCW